MDRNERIAAALSGIRAKMDERASLRAQLADKSEALVTLQASADRWRRLAEMDTWAELELKSRIRAGTQVRHLLHVYECKVEHSKTILHPPTDGNYWDLVE